MTKMGLVGFGLINRVGTLLAVASVLALIVWAV